MRKRPERFVVFRTSHEPKRRQPVAVIKAKRASLVLALLRDKLPHLTLRPHEVFDVVPMGKCSREQLLAVRLIHRLAREAGYPGYIAA